MASQTDIPSDLTDDDKAYLFQVLDANLNSQILFVLLYGIYTGILAISLWHIVINKSWTSRRSVVIFIVILLGLITIDVAANWVAICLAFIQNGHNFWTVYLNLKHNVGAVYWMMEITSTISTILADVYIIWCCWMIWGGHSRGCQWLIVLLPICSLVAAIVSKAIMEYYNTISGWTTMNVLLTLYICSVLATTLYCTLLIITRIMTATGGLMGRLGAFRRFIVVLVESSALYSLALILYLVLFIRRDNTSYYFSITAAIAKGVAPTLIVGRAAAGHTRPREDDDGSTVSSLHFQIPSAHSTTSSHLGESTVQSSILEMDIEAQPERQVGQVVEQDMVVSTASEAVIVE